MKVNRQIMDVEQKQSLDVICTLVKAYVNKYYKPLCKRHTKTTITFVGDMYKPEDIDAHFRKIKMR